MIRGGGVQYYSLEQLAAGVAKWQVLLHLQDWEIAAELVPQSYFPERTISGEAHIKSQRRGATIRMASFETIDLVASPIDGDMERTLVHELVHLVFSPEDLFGEPPPKHQNRAYEIAVESMTRTLIELDRRAA